MMTINDVCKILLEKDNFEIITHASPDGDTLGCGFGLCLALQQLGKNARVITEKLPKKFLFMAETVKEQQFECEYIVSTDIAADTLFGDNKEKYFGKINLCIDHHGSNSLTAEKKYVDSTCAAACEIIYKIVVALGAEVTKPIANCLYTGIATDTGCFKFTNTSSQTHKIAAELFFAGCDYGAINKRMFETKTKGRFALEQELFKSMEYCAKGKCAIICISQDMLNRLDVTEEDTEGIEGIPRQIDGVLMGITMKEKDDGAYKISVRTNDNVNASDFCKQFGGGGHPAASGCRIEGDFATVRNALVTAAEKAL